MVQPASKSSAMTQASAISTRTTASTRCQTRSVIYLYLSTEYEKTCSLVLWLDVHPNAVAGLIARLHVQLRRARVDHRRHFDFDQIHADISRRQDRAGDLQRLAVEQHANRSVDVRRIIGGSGDAGGPVRSHTSQPGGENLNA